MIWKFSSSRTIRFDLSVCKLEELETGLVPQFDSQTIAGFYCPSGHGWLHHAVTAQHMEASSSSTLSHVDVWRSVTRSLLDHVQKSYVSQLILGLRQDRGLGEGMNDLFQGAGWLSFIEGPKDAGQGAFRAFWCPSWALYVRKLIAKALYEDLLTSVQSGSFNPTSPTSDEKKRQIWTANLWNFHVPIVNTS